MQEYKVIVTPQAQEQIVDIARYIKCELESPMAMNNFLETVYVIAVIYAHRDQEKAIEKMLLN